VEVVELLVEAVVEAVVLELVGEEGVALVRGTKN
jgi:hypothetical protein